MSNAQTNYGIIALNPAPLAPQRTIAATGLGRSGRTMVARVMIDLGLEMGNKLKPQSAEDEEFQTALKKSDMDQFSALCRSRDNDHDVWAFKCPALRGKLFASAVAEMRAPRVIVTFRDILAVSVRNTLSVDADLFEALSQAAAGYVGFVKNLRELDVPVLLMCYEKALQFPEQLVSQMADFVGVEVSQEEITRIAQSNIQNADPRYARR